MEYSTSTENPFRVPATEIKIGSKGFGVKLQPHKRSLSGDKEIVIVKNKVLMIITRGYIS